MLDPIVVLDAEMTVDAARGALSGARDADLVVVRRLHPDGSGTVLWYPLPLPELSQLLAIAQPDMPLGIALDLHEHGASPTREATSADVQDGVWTGLVVHGGRALGYAHATKEPTRGIEFPTAPTTPQTPAPVPGTVGRGKGGSYTSGVGGLLGGPEAPPEPEAPTESAFPRVDVPEQVAPAAPFIVTIGLGAQVQAGIGGQGIQPLILQRQTTELTVQVKADCFFVEQVRFTLPVDLANLGAHTITVPLVAPSPPRLPWRGRIEVEYSANGLLLGSAWRELTVGAAPTPTISTSGGDTTIQLAPGKAIDLTVSISRGMAGGKFLWTFTTPHPVELPTEQVETELDHDTAETFALRKVRELGQVAGSANCELKIAGVAREVAGIMPVWFWKVLTAVWAIAKAEGRLPTVLLVSKESLVPWELATTDPDHVVDRTLVDESAPQVLGAQVALGRWRPAGPDTPSGVRRPSTQPAESIELKQMAVVVGEYGPATGMRALPQAIEEGKQLTEAYPSVWVKGTDSEVASLLRGTLTDRGTPVAAQVLHIAAHGEIDPGAPLNAGVVLSDTTVHIDESIVLGSEFARTAAPFVFLNCCQVASDAGGSLLEGGLAAAFLEAGARGFIAPLWSVNDQVAKDTAVRFYQEVVTSGRPVGEVVRELRARFNEFPQRDQPTPLAYVYFGHPGLLFTR